MKNEDILMRNFDILDAVCNSLVEILNNLESILHHLEPLNNYEEKEEDIFTNFTEKRNDIIILSNVIYNNISNVNIILHDFIKTIPPSYTYYSSFYYNDFLILKEKKKKDEKREDEKGKSVCDSKLENLITTNEKLINKNETVNKNSTDTNSMCNILKNYNSSLQNTETVGISNRNEYEQIEDSLYFSFLIDLEYANLLYMKKYEDEIKEYLIHMN